MVSEESDEDTQPELGEHFSLCLRYELRDVDSHR